MGDPLRKPFRCKTFTIKVFSPDGSENCQKTQAAPIGKFFTEELIKQLVDEALKNLSATFPDANYRALRIGKTQANFVAQ